MRLWGIFGLISVMGLTACGRMRMAAFESRNANIATSSPGATPSATPTPTPNPTPTPTPNPNFGLPVKKIEVIVGDVAPVFKAFDLTGSSTSVAMKVSNPGTLPPGLTYSSVLGTITGTPTVPGQYTVEVCYIENSIVTNTCANVVYSILAETDPIPANQRVNTDPDPTCSSSIGLGDLGNPIQLSTAEDLNTCVRNYPKAAFRLAADIDLSSYPGSAPATSFNPLPFFYGNFDGNNKTIRNWNWDLVASGVAWPAAAGTNNYFNGLFRGIGMGAVVKNLTLENVNVNTGFQDIGSYSRVNGILAGVLRGGAVFNIRVAHSNLNCPQYCGGLIGQIYNPIITNTFPADPSTDYREGYINRVTLDTVNVNSHADFSYMGGVIGLYTVPFRISKATTTGVNLVTGNIGGGIAAGIMSNAAGTSNDSRFWMDRCSSSGSVNGNPVQQGAFLGGLIGLMRGSDTITDSYSSASIHSNDMSAGGAGGLVGSIEPGMANEKTAIIAFSYYSGSVSGPVESSGLLIGKSHGAWYGAGTLTGQNGIQLVHNKIQTDPTYGAFGSTQVPGRINVRNNSNQVFTDLPLDWSIPGNFLGWLNSIWSLGGAYPTHL